MVRTGQIPIVPSSEWNNDRWMDNRVCCGYARRDDPTGPQKCRMVGKFESGKLYCRLGDGRPCVFDEPESAEIWERIREQQQYDKGVSNE